MQRRHIRPGMRTFRPLSRSPQMLSDCQSPGRAVSWRPARSLHRGCPTGSAAMEDLLIVTTGGTIDKIYFDDKSDYQIGDPQIGQILKELGVTFRFSVTPIIRKDSLHITDADRELIRATIAAQPTRHVLITHGTDSMVETGKVLQTIAGKTIVMTGALNPARFRGSDAEFNIGCAVGAVQSLPAGVYIAMNGRIWKPEKVRKNVAANRFESV
ncbi:asparaginase [Xanthomonas oryzae pv. oryzae KACC 10331]|uniref:Asparaginase n=2 Tax=Xanthomonas oryzae pv. oryzae TaxID=64187 RepID=Q5GWP8_XANOR|nr:asparaginase [Xanthomonas oryzae pv. oryzae KACC 10331]